MMAMASRQQDECGTPLHLVTFISVKVCRENARMRGAVNLVSVAKCVKSFAAKDSK